MPPSKWDNELELYLLRCLRADPHVELRKLGEGIEKDLGRKLSRDTLAHYLSKKIYRNHADVALARGVGGQSGREGRLVQTRIVELLAPAVADGRYEIEIKPFLNQALIDTCEGRPSSAGAKDRYQLLGRLQRWSRGGAFVVRKRRSVREAVRDAVLREISAGRSLDEVMNEARLAGTDRRMVVEYVMTEGRTVAAAAELIGVKTVTASFALKRALNRLEGRDADHHRKEKFFAMTDEELATQIRATGVKSRFAMRQRNQGLYYVAEARGLIEVLFPRKLGSATTRLRKVLTSALKKSATDELLRDLDALERGVVLKRGLADPPEPFEYFKRAYGLSNLYEMHSIERRLAKKLAERPYPTKVMHDLRSMWRRADPQALALVQARLDEKERELLATRILRTDGCTLKELGSKWGVTRERARQIEEKLFERTRALFEAYEGGGADAVTAALAVRKVDHRRVLISIRDALTTITSADLARLRLDLKPRELELLEKRALASSPVRLADLAESWNRKFESAKAVERRLLQRLRAMTGSACGRPSDRICA